MPDYRPILRQFIADNFILSAQSAVYADADSFVDRHIMDSTGFLELISFIEEHWQIAVADEEMVPENLDGLDKLQVYLSRKLAA